MLGNLSLALALILFLPFALQLEVLLDRTLTEESASWPNEQPNWISHFVVDGIDSMLSKVIPQPRRSNSLAPVSMHQARLSHLKAEDL